MSLYVVATPIGNLKDITLRAIETLRQVDLIACEDTRTTRILLRHYQISTPSISYHEHNEARRIPELLERLKRGQSVAVVSDAGTPAISDPGLRIVRAAAEAGVQVVPIPGPTALIAALAGAGFPTDRFFFAGFLSSKKQARRRELYDLARVNCTLILYESPRRVSETLSDIAAIFGADRPIAIARELTKIHEEFARGTAGELAANFKSTRGEITLLVAPGGNDPSTVPSDRALLSEYRRLLREGVHRNEALRLLGKKYGLARRVLYSRIRVRPEA